MQFYLTSLRGKEYFAKEPEPGVFGPLEPEPESLEKKYQEPEPLGKKIERRGGYKTEGRRGTQLKEGGWY